MLGLSIYDDDEGFHGPAMYVAIRKSAHIVVDMFAIPTEPVATAVPFATAAVRVATATLAAGAWRLLSLDRDTGVPDRLPQSWLRASRWLVRDPQLQATTIP